MIQKRQARKRCASAPGAKGHGEQWRRTGSKAHARMRERGGWSWIWYSRARHLHVCSVACRGLLGPLGECRHRRPVQFRSTGSCRRRRERVVAATLGFASPSTAGTATCDPRQAAPPEIVAAGRDRRGCLPIAAGHCPRGTRVVAAALGAAAVPAAGPAACDPRQAAPPETRPSHLGWRRGHLQAGQSLRAPRCGPGEVAPAPVPAIRGGDARGRHPGGGHLRRGAPRPSPVRRRGHLRQEGRSLLAPRCGLRLSARLGPGCCSCQGTRHPRPQRSEHRLH